MAGLSYNNDKFLSSGAARPIRLLSEYLYPKTELEKQNITDTIVIFGSARIPSPENTIAAKHPLSSYYTAAMEFARLVTEWGQNLPKHERKLLICTGGGPGIMEAGNRGAKLAGGKSICLNITLPHEQDVNPYADMDLSFEFRYFFMRKFWFLRHCRGLIAFPGGFGTMDEIFEVLTLVQTGKTKKIPVILYGTDFWKRMFNFELLVEYGMIKKEDLDIFSFSDSPEDAAEKMKKSIDF